MSWCKAAGSAWGADDEGDDDDDGDDDVNGAAVAAVGAPVGGSVAAAETTDGEDGVRSGRSDGKRGSWGTMAGRLTRRASTGAGEDV